MPPTWSSPESPDPELMTAVRAQVERILSLDVDGSGFPAVGERDPVVGRLQQRYPGLRPIGFWSPYEAAAWTIIGHRIRIRQAAAIKARMAAQLGDPVTFGDRVVHAFPAPDRLASLEEFPGTGRAQAGVAQVGGAGRPGRPARRGPAARAASRHRAERPEDACRASETSQPG